MEFAKQEALVESPANVEVTRGRWAGLADQLGLKRNILVVLGLLSAEATEPFVLSLMAFLATLGVFFLFGLAAGHVRVM